MPTALQLGPKRWKAYLGRRPSVDQTGAGGQEDQSVLMAQTRNAAARIKSDLGANRVILIGSLAHNMWWDQESDVDLVVEGLTGEKYWEAWAIAEQIIKGRQVEVIDLESATPRLRQTVEKEGLTL